MMYAIDRIEGGIAVCENLSGGDTFNINTKALPHDAKEGDIVKKIGDTYVIDRALTEERKAALNNRMNRLFKRG